MRSGAIIWGVLAISSFVGAFSCSGKNLNEVGELNTAGDAGANVGGMNSPAGGALATAGKAGSEAALGGAGAGIGGVVADVAGDGGTAGVPGGGEAGQGPYGCANCTTVASGQDVRGTDVNDQKVAWSDYGTYDKLGNYQDDGRLLVRDLDTGATNILADSLGGPEAIGVSAKYAYVALDKRDDAKLPGGVVRVPLTGGPVQPLQASADTTGPQLFLTMPDYEYWNSVDGVSRVAQTDGAQVEIFFPSPVGALFAVDDTRLYFFSEVSAGNLAFGTTSSVWTIPLTGGNATKLTDYPGGMLKLQGSYLYGIEHVDFGGGTYLTRMPKAGGAWKRVANAHNGIRWASIAVDGDSYLVDEQADTLRWIFRGTLVGPDTTLDFEAAPVVRSTAWRGWAVSRVGIFFANADGLYVTPTTAP
jgi:hypothetical protein